jgi:hypothetical protein
MSTEMQTKVQASPAQNFTPAQTGLLQRKCALCNTLGLVKDSEQDKEKLTLQRSSVVQAGTTTVPRFGHDFSRVSVHSTGPGMIQTKLKINKPGDPYEQEADRVAEQVMRMPESRLQRQPIEEELQAKATSGHLSEVNPHLESHIQSLNRSSQPLPESTRAYFEPRFGRDFSQVRLHTDTQAVESAQAVNARAFTMGSDVVFGAGQYAPEASDGRRLMAHELAHVVQQGEISKLRVKLSDAIQRQEAESAPAAAQVAASARTRFTGSNFTGATVIADVEFVDSLEAINRHAGNSNVQVHVTHSFRGSGQTVQGAIVTPATRSNHLAGHAIDMNVRSGGRLYTSADLGNLQSCPQNVRNFINAIRNDPRLRWGGDFGRSDPVHIDDGLNNDIAAWQRRFNTTQANPNP